MSRGAERPVIKKDVQTRPAVALDKVRQPQAGKGTDNAPKNATGEVKRVVHGRVVDVSPERVKQELARIERSDFGKETRSVPESRTREKVNLSMSQIEETLAKIAQQDFGLKPGDGKKGAPKEIADTLTELEKSKETGQEKITVGTDRKIMVSTGDGSTPGDTTGGPERGEEKSKGPGSGGGGTDVPGGPVDPPGGGGTRGGDGGDSGIPGLNEWKNQLSDRARDFLDQGGPEMVRGLHKGMVAQLGRMDPRDRQEFLDKQNAYFELISSVSVKEVKDLFAGVTEDREGNRERFRTHDRVFGDLLEMLPRRSEVEEVNKIAEKAPENVTEQEVERVREVGGNAVKSLGLLADRLDEVGQQENARGVRSFAEKFQEAMEKDREAQKISDLIDEAVMDKNKKRASLLLYAAVLVNLVAAIRVPESAG